MMLRPIVLPHKHYLGSPREWGMPTCFTAGKVMWSENRSDISCFLPLPNGKVRVETRRLSIQPQEEPWLPTSWHKAMGIYATVWPHSASFQAYFCKLISNHLRTDMMTHTQQMIQVEIDRYPVIWDRYDDEWAAGLLTAWTGYPYS